MIRDHLLTEKWDPRPVTTPESRVCIVDPVLGLSITTEQVLRETRVSEPQLNCPGEPWQHVDSAYGEQQRAF